MSSVISFFSINLGMLKQGIFPANLYVNSSALKNVDHFVRIFEENKEMTEDDVKRFGKYPGVFISESDRQKYISYIVRVNDVEDHKKTEVLKESAIVYLSKLFDPSKEFTTELLTNTIAECKFAVEGMIDVIGDYSIDNLRELIGEMSFHDFYTYDHSINVSMYCMIILKAIKPNIHREELIHIGLGGLLHDLGKIKISTAILNKSTSLTTEEYDEIKKHPQSGVDLLIQPQCQLAGGINKDILIKVIGQHHENMDGTGYPHKIFDKQIHVYAKICAIADFFDAITTKRSYSQILPIDEALAVMAKTSGKKLNKPLFEFFSNHIQHGQMIKGKYRLKDEFDPAVCYANLPLEELDLVAENEIEIKETMSPQVLAHFNYAQEKEMKNLINQNTKINQVQVKKLKIK